MRDVELPDERAELVDDDLIVTAEREASSLSAQRESRPVDENGDTVLSQAEIDEADEGTEPESDADALDAQAPKRGI
jgi:hypothetical protein